jgi:hypothetical protein
MKEWNLYKARKESMVKDERRCFVDDHIVDKEVGRIGLQFEKNNHNYGRTLRWENFVVNTLGV